MHDYISEATDLETQYLNQNNQGRQSQFKLAMLSNKQFMQ